MVALAVTLEGVFEQLGTSTTNGTIIAASGITATNGNLSTRALGILTSMGIRG